MTEANRATAEKLKVSTARLDDAYLVLDACSLRVGGPHSLIATDNIIIGVRN